MKIQWILRPILLLSLATQFCFLVQPSNAADVNAIRIGAVLPFSGGVELYGNQAKLGLDLAAKEINAGGGILGRPVEIIYEDDKTNPEAADRAVRKLIEREGVLAIVGPITSRNLNAITPTVNSLKTPLLYATNYEGGACSRYIFAFSTVPNQELAQLLPYMTRNFGNTYYLLGANRLWPQKMFEAAEPLIAGLGGRVVGKKFTTGSETDFTDMIKRIADSKAKVLLFALKGDGLNFIGQAHDQGLMKSMTVAFLGLSETDLTVFGEKGQNMFVVVPFVARSDTSSVKAFVARANSESGSGTVSNYVMTHYNALMAVKAALKKSGKVDKEAMIDALEGLTIATPHRKGDHRQRPSFDDEPVHCQDKGSRSRYRSRAWRHRSCRGL
jgi:branched-chain amino acid transport system substrate-binding protein/urea transport system substrate-binding protein